MNFLKLKTLFTAYRKIAALLSKDKKRTMIKMQQGSKKALQHKMSLAFIWDNLQVLFSIAKDYANGDYTAIPKGSIIAIIGALLYFISPIDLIPDFVAGLGFADDVYILSMVSRQVSKDLEKYKAWKASKGTIISI